MILRSSLLFLLTVSPLSAADVELKGTAAELARFLSGAPGIVTVTGEGKVHVPAERSVVTLIVTTENRFFAEALRKNESARSALVQSLTKKGLPADRIQSLKFSSVPEIGRFSGKVKNYRVENRVKVTVENEAQLLAVAELVDQRGEVLLDSIEPDHPNLDDFKQKALAEACQDVLKKQKTIEMQFKVKLAPRKIMGNPEEAPKGGGGGASQPLFFFKEMVSSVNPGSGGLASFGELVFEAKIAVEFELRKE